MMFLEAFPLKHVVWILLKHSWCWGPTKCLDFGKCQILKEGLQTSVVEPLIQDQQFWILQNVESKQLKTDTFSPRNTNQVIRDPAWDTFFPRKFLADGKIILAGGKIILAGGKIILAGGEIQKKTEEKSYSQIHNTKSWCGLVISRTGHLPTIQLGFWRP